MWKRFLADGLPVIACLLITCLIGHFLSPYRIRHPSEVGPALSFFVNTIPKTILGPVVFLAIIIIAFCDLATALSLMSESSDQPLAATVILKTVLVANCLLLAYY